MNIVLCGMMGAGKTSVGIKIADLTGMRWYDTDDLIVQKYGKIPAIFEFYGEERFREMESEIVRGISEEDNAVISTGGGCVLRPENSAALKKHGKIIFLKVDIAVLFERTGHTSDERPLLQGHKDVPFIAALMEQRRPKYEAAADITVDTSRLNIEEVCRQVLRQVSER